MKIVAYYRVSTDRQGRSGLGLAAQRKAVETYGLQRGAEVIAEFVEVETGKRADRPKLQEALARARQSDATLVVAKLDRLSREVHFIAGLMKAGVPFDCVDRPGADPFRLHIEAAVAEEECRKIGERTRAALAAAKAKGVLLGSHRPGCRGKLTSEARQRGSAATAEAARRHHAGAAAIVAARRAIGQSLREIADELNDLGFVTQRKLPYTATAVHRLSVRSA